MSFYDLALTVQAVARLDALEGRPLDIDAINESRATLERLDVPAPAYGEPSQARVAL
jgi:hypothetical protein